MDNDYGSFWFWLSVVANYCQIESYEMNKKQISNDEILKRLERQDNVLFEKVFAQNEIIIAQNEEILKLLRKEK